MFGRSSYKRNVSNIGDHLRGIQTELNKIGNTASQQASHSASAGADQVRQLIGAISPVLEDLAGLFNQSQSHAADLSRKALRAGSDSATRVTSQTKEQPMLMLAVAFGIGILIGFSSKRVGSR
jgi:ElaB/YqjD/DUF883 family membrane-anchored ribosome-binding protein